MASSFSFGCCKCLLLFSINAAYFIIAFVLYFGGTSQYGKVISAETGEWADTPIIDVIAQSNSSCPTGYILIQFDFHGTKTICNKGLWYNIGSCGRREAGWTVYGLSDRRMSKINGNYVCVKREPNPFMTYHALADLRSQSINDSCPSEMNCGSKTDYQKNFCLLDNSTQCPPNSFFVWPQETNSTLPNNSIISTNFTSSYKSHLVYDWNTTNPISDIYISMSRACGNKKSDYMRRSVPIKKIYSDELDECHYSDDTSGQENPLYIAAGFGQTELEIYSANNVLSDIKSKVPDYNDNDLKQNSYQIYYKTYSQWSYECQTVKNLTTLSLANQAANIEEAGEYFYALFIITMILYGTQCVLLILMCICAGGKLRLCFQQAVHVLVGLLETFGYVALVIIYCISIEAYNSIEIKTIGLMRDNKCADQVLGHAIDVFYGEYYHDYYVLGIGLAFVLVAAIIKVVVCLVLSPLRERIGWENQTRVQIILDKIGERLASKITRRGASAPEGSAVQHDENAGPANVSFEKDNNEEPNGATDHQTHNPINQTDQTMTTQRLASMPFNGQKGMKSQKLPPIINQKKVAGPNTRGSVLNENDMNELSRD